MKRFIPSLFIMLVFTAGGAFAQDMPPVPSNSFLSQQASDAREDQLYTQATDAMNARNYQDAATKFSQVAQMKGRKADSALYWKAWNLNKAGNRTDAAAAIAELRAKYPKSTWLKDAAVLECEWRKCAPEQVIGDGVPGGIGGGVPGGIGIGRARGRGDGEGNPDDDIKSQALFGIMNNDPERGIPICQDIMKNPNQSSRLKERCLFLLAQNDSPKANEVIMAVAKGNSGPDLQIRAIRNLGVSGDRYIPALTDIYASSNSPEVKRAVLGAYMTSGAKGELLKAINTEKDPEMRRRAIRQLGPMGASRELEQLYGSTQSPDDQEVIIQALAITGDTSLLGRIAKTGANVDVRKRAIRSLGITGDKSHALLLDLFNTDKDPEIRKSVTDALFVSGGCAEMVTLARKETDYDVKKTLINKISLMNCKEGRDYMMELLK